MRFQPIELELDHFASVKHLVVDLDKPAGLYFIYGRNELEQRLSSNDCGKTTIFNALCWVLTGKTLRGTRAPELVPWNDTGGFVGLVFKCDDTEHYLARSLARPNQPEIDDQLVDQAAIDRLIRHNFDTLVHTWLIGQSNPLFFDLGPTAKLDLLTDALDLNRWDVRAKAAKDKAEEFERLFNDGQGKLESLVNQYKSLRNTANEVLRRANEWEQQAAEALEGTEAELAKARSDAEALQKKHDAANLAYDGAGTEVAPLRRHQQQIADYLRHTAVELAQAEAKRTAALAERKRLQDSIEELKGSKCPTCGQPLTAKHKHDIAETRRGLEAELAAVADRCSGGVIRTLKQQQDDLNRQMTASKRDLEAFEKKEADARASLDYVIPLLAEAKAKEKALQDKLKQYRDTLNPHRETLRDLERKKKLMAAEYKSGVSIQKGLEAQWKRHAFWAKEFGFVKLALLQEVLDELAFASNAIRDQLGLIGWEIRYEIERETKAGTTARGLQVLILSPRNTKAVRWEVWGGGAGQRLRIAGALALAETLLQRAGVEPTLEVLDEPSNHLSAAGVEDLVDFLHDRAEQLGRTILLIDQTVIPSDRFAATFTVVRSAEGTRIEAA